ncbi:hypothetical protein Goklo_024176, partial [Gossypium klotzschianum]|nr:hypothetical protein [Gossypium klotzschianum]
SLKTLFPFSVARNLQQLERLTVYSCGVEEIISKIIRKIKRRGHLNVEPSDKNSGYANETQWRPCSNEKPDG